MAPYFMQVIKAFYYDMRRTSVEDYKCIIIVLCIITRLKF